MSDCLDLSVDGRGVATLTLMRPDKHNALSAALIADLTTAAGELAQDERVRVIVLAGAGKSFCAGADLGWMREQIKASGTERGQAARALAGMLQALNTLPKPVIGRVQGNAFGGGIGMMSVCDAAITVQGARFGLTETRLGLTPATISPYVMARMGEASARRVFMSSRLFDADEAVALGLASRAVAADALDAAIEAEVVPYLSCAPGAVAASKALTRRLGAPIGEREISDSVEALIAQWESDEAAEGIAAFFEKRAPRWAVPD